MHNKLLDSYLNDKPKHNLSKYITKYLIMIIIVLSSLIYTSLSDKNLNTFKKYVFENHFNFAKFNSFYKKISVINNDAVLVSQNNDLTSYESYKEGTLFHVSSNYPVRAITPGIVIYIGPKEEFENVIIIQGSNGFDIWYASLENISVQMYDYVELDTILGEVNNKLYMLISKDEKYYSYEEYQNQI